MYGMRESTFQHFGSNSPLFGDNPAGGGVGGGGGIGNFGTDCSMDRYINDQSISQSHDTLSTHS